jgi:DNA repair exonuclease SbcCD ATPase subunit
MADSLISIAQELYGVGLSEFTPNRNARAKELKNDDVMLSKQVAALRKPSPAAWIVNVLARERAEDIEELVALGGAMRGAQEDLDRDALTRLGKQRRNAVAALLTAAKELGAERGQKLSASVASEVEQTLQAATVDLDAAAAVLSGRLIRSLDASGFELVDLDEAVAAPEPGSRAAAQLAPPVDIADARKRSLARKEAARLENEADAAHAKLAKLTQQLEQARDRRAELDKEVTRLRDALASAEVELGGLAETEDALADEQADAEAAVERAEKAAQAARTALD